MQDRIRPMVKTLVGSLVVAALEGARGDVIVDNSTSNRLAIVGAWTASKSTGGYYGVDYMHDNRSDKGGKSVAYTPLLSETGLYEVFARWTSGSNRATNTPITVRAADGATALLANQRVAGGTWNSLGTYPMVANAQDNVLLSNAGTAPASYVIADAMRFVKLPDAEFIVDNTNAARVTLTGTWTSSTSSSGYYAKDYVHDGNTGKGQKSVRFAPLLPAAGSYEVYLRWTSSSGRATNVPVIVTWAGGANEVVVNQRLNGGKWNSLGTYRFLQGDLGTVTIGTAGTTSGHVIADAVRFVRKACLWTPRDLGDQLWLHWSADDLSDGEVTRWVDRRRGVAAYQTNDVALKPSKQAGEVLFSAGNKRLIIDKQDSAHMTHRAVMVLFRLDVSGSQQSGTLFAVNGVDGGGANRQPAVTFDAVNDKVGVNWRTPDANNTLSFPLATDKTQWHCLVSRRTCDDHFASLDGWQADGVTPGEASLPMANWALAKNPYTDSPTAGVEVKGYVGDFRTTASPEMAVDTIVVVQGELCAEDAEKLMGWGMWKRGLQDELPADHPYRHHPPYVSAPEYQFVESTPQDYTNSVVNWFTPTSDPPLEVNFGAPLDLSGWGCVFEDEFDIHSVTHEARGKGNWFGPVHPDATGAAISVFPGVTSTNATIGTAGSPATYIHDPTNGTMTIRMQKDGSNWKSGCFCSINTSGYGQTWMYPYVEVRMKTGPSSTGNKHGSWPAVWLLSRNFFSNRTESYVEYDIYEGYISDSDGFHNSYHNHDAPFEQPGRLTKDRYVSNYLGLGNASSYSHWGATPIDLFDNQYHVYAAMVTPEWVITYFDDLEVARFPTPVEMMQPLWVLVDLAMKSSEAANAAGVYELVVDYVRVYQNADYLD